MPRVQISVLLPTRNRPADAARTIRSILRQDVAAPFEVVVTENSDDDGAVDELRREFAGEPRVRLHRTGGLALDENWEAALSAADGEYLILTGDKVPLRRHALSTALGACERHACLIAGWRLTGFMDEVPPSRLFTFVGSGAQRVVGTTDLVAAFIREPEWAHRHGFHLPAGVGAVLFHHSLARAARQGPAGALFAPVAPDFTSIFQLLALTDRLVLIDEPLCIYTCRASGAAASILKSDAQGQALEARLPASERRPMEDFPFPYRTMVNVVLRDYERIQRLYPRLPALEIWLPGYFGTVLSEALVFRRLVALETDEQIRRVRETVSRLPAAEQAAIDAYCEEQYGVRLEAVDTLGLLGEPVDFKSAWDLLEWEERGGAYLQELEKEAGTLERECQEKEAEIQELAAACSARDQEIQSLAAAARERLALIEELQREKTVETKAGDLERKCQECQEKEAVIQELAAAARERLALIEKLQREKAGDLERKCQECQEKEAVIQELAAAARERLALIEKLHAALQRAQGGVLSTVRAAVRRWARGTRAAR